jgi:lipoate-protein ligase A
MLQRYPRPGVARFRHYGWHGPAFTFGYSQKIEFVRARLPAGERLDICRRATGGGVVDHRDDWTYALVIPRGHALEEVRATQSYRIVHDCLAGALVVQGVTAGVKEIVPTPNHLKPAYTLGIDPFGLCFDKSELYDVINTHSGDKISGAAQKRNKHGLLFQGSIWRPAVGKIDWSQFDSDFSARIAVALEAKAERVPWPEINEDEVSSLTEHYSSPEWIELR